jgi:F-type H+-transporting ATPase subunit alpha
MVELLKQPQFKPMNVVDQVMVIFAGTKGYLDKIPQKQVAAWEEQFLQYMREQKPDVRNTLMKERKLSPALEKQLAAAVATFQGQFRPPT